VAAARRLLAALGGEGEQSETAGVDSARALERGQLWLSLSQRRVAVLDRSFSAEAPFMMLLALYATEKREPSVTVTNLTQLAGTTPSTTLRWIEPLMDGGWITRSSVAEDRRKALISLTEKARRGLEELFSWPE
jgi:DNA-binding MarR family transcriptional regulator